ncbi:MAG: hypothetical protein B6I20_07140 [Bacteroidetes bacterium 4572_117]|nr:MAG: hypothetical protein B6I20_07140 [Bacteroidetes bacterium 4572_117]
MKKKICFSFLLISFSFITIAQTVKIKKLPKSIEEFVSMRNKIATTPQGGAAMFMIALKIHTTNPDLAKKCFVAIVDRKLLREGDVYKGFKLLNSDMGLIKSQVAKDKNIPNSYIKGATPKNHYKVKLPYIFEFSSNKYSGSIEAGDFKLFIACSGASSPRPIRMKKNNRGLWKTSNWSSVLVGIMKPPIDDDL